MKPVEVAAFLSTAVVRLLKFCHLQMLHKMTMNCWCPAGTILHAVCHTLSELISVRGFRRDGDLGTSHVFYLSKARPNID